MTLGSAGRSGILNIMVRGAEGGACQEDCRYIRYPLRKGVPSGGISFWESPSHNDKTQEKRKSLRAWWTAVSYTGSAITYICHLRTILKGKEPRWRLPGPLHKAQQEVGLVGASEILMDRLSSGPFPACSPHSHTVTFRRHLPGVFLIQATGD